jgi:hypothetical protein
MGSPTFSFYRPSSHRKGVSGISDSSQPPRRMLDLPQLQGAGAVPFVQQSTWSGLAWEQDDVQSGGRYWDSSFQNVFWLEKMNRRRQLAICLMCSDPISLLQMC